jgi:ABC transporter substrate binding protein (PQQ-dependent alcohol dehydrogenase system)
MRPAAFPRISRGPRHERRALALILGSVLSAGCFAPAKAENTKPAAESAAPAAAQKAVEKVPLLYARQLRPDQPPPLSLLDLPNADDGIAGARLAVMDNNTTGKFLGQDFAIEIAESADPKELVASVVKLVDAGTPYIVADLEPQTLVALADALKSKPALIVNAGSPDDGIREENCRPNVKHTPPSRTMLADSLAQYLVWKRWLKWFLIVGPTPEDQLTAEAYRRAAKKFGAKIVEERTFKYEVGSRRSDGGYEQVQQQIPTFTQGAQAHDVVMVADEGSLFGDYLPYRTWDARPVAGTSGLYATSWHPALELWGGTQFQNRFKRLAGRNMKPIDYTAWMAVRAIGEAATRTKSAAPGKIIPYMSSPQFELAAFKGIRTTFRDWNGQLRQPTLVATPKLPVSVSPQPGFLHQVSELDTLGIDQPESKCKGYKP